MPQRIVANSLPVSLLLMIIGKDTRHLRPIPDIAVHHVKQRDGGSLITFASIEPKSTG